MAYVVTEPCVDCKYTSCVEVCPVEAFREGKDRVYIEPEVCIDCNACVPACPVEAIFSDFEVPVQWRHWIEINARESLLHPALARAKTPLKGPNCTNPNAA